MAAAKSSKLEDHAATAALYVSGPQRDDQSKAKYLLDEDNKLSSAGAATSLKYANPRDLPSYPIAGLASSESSAGAAASLANSNQKAFEHWKPDPSASANKAAMMAKDYKAAALWHPETTEAGSKAAALAAKDGGHVDIWRPEVTKASNSAAGRAMRKKGLSHQMDHGSTDDGINRALAAATGAMSGSRKRSGSTPVPGNLFPDSENSGANALSAAMSASKPHIRGQTKKEILPGFDSVPLDGARIHNAAITNLSREMYTSHPPVAPEVEEKNRQAGLRAAAVSMAKQMYDVQQKAIDQAQELDRSERSDSQFAAKYLHNLRPSISSADSLNQPPTQYINLQEAAQKLASERLAKLHDEHAAYRNYYGTNAAPQSRLSIRNRQRMRASSDGQVQEPDEDRSLQIRSDMTRIDEKLSKVDEQKRRDDRDLLMLAAQRNVKVKMHGIDEKIFAETGKASPAMMTDWEVKANARAKANSDARMINHGKVDIGGGKYLDQSEIDAIASKRVQPTLDDLTKKAEMQRAHDDQLRLEEYERNQIAAARATEEKERASKTKEEWKRFREEEKRELRSKKDELKARKAQEKQKPKGAAKSAKLPQEESLTTLEPSFVPFSADKHKSTYSPSEKNQLYNQTPIRPENEDSAVIEQGNSDEAGAKQPLQAEASFEKDIEPMQTLYMEELVPPEPSARSDKNVSEGGTPDPNSFLERAVSTIDSTLIDPALRRQPNPEDVVLKRSTTQSKESIRSTGLINAAVITARVMSAPVETDYTDVDTSLEIVLSKDESGSTDNKAPLSEEATTLDKAKSEEVAREPTKSEQSKTTLEATTAPSSTVHTTISGPSITPKSPKGESKVSSWLKTKFYRRPSKPVKTEINDPTKSSSSDFIAAAPPFVPIPSDDEEPHNESAESRTLIESREVPDNAQERLSENNIDTRPQLGRQEHLSISSSIGSVSSSEGTRGRSELRRELTSSSHGDNFEEAQDSFESGKLAPPMVLRDKAHGSDSPVRDSRFQENL